MFRVYSNDSGSFVSEDGLLISNHHVGGSSLQKLSTKEKNYLRDGFYAHTPAEELKCLDLEINVLQSIDDVSDRVNAAIPAGAEAAAAFPARRKVIAEIEKESLDKTGLRSDVVTLYDGGEYQGGTKVVDFTTSSVITWLSESGVTAARSGMGGPGGNRGQVGGRGGLPPAGSGEPPQRTQ